ncbi:kinase-like domain-containing protein [Cristinia sonorae]|uniref:Kinase-like domain-containing protein n=1 Tax=Cristinia sonorae TaxID=1940300 RepID=A0A8K0XQ64_9AGAR|nr:kinase-like domain-containing protein [Cristinia sonorae]
MLAQRALLRYDYSSSVDDEYGSLSPYELRWRARYDVLLSNGYRLRPRYKPGWKPSWLGTNTPADECEDFIQPIYTNVLDAQRVEDHRVVCMKVVPLDSDEFKIVRMLSPTDNHRNPYNHCVPILDVLSDPINALNAILVMPYLRPCNNPNFDTVDEIMEFVKQTLEGLSFLHSQGVAHRDCWTTNIMMDGQELYPEGHHPIRLNWTPDYSRNARVLRRSGHPVKYYFIDFGMSSYFEVGQSPYVVGAKGADQDPPELSDEVPYNAFMLDVFVLGHAYEVDLLQQFSNLDFLQPLISAMMDTQPERRPTAEAALMMFHNIRTGSKHDEHRRRAARRGESTTGQVVQEAVSVLRGFVGF